MRNNAKYYIIPLIEEYKNATGQEKQTLARKIAVAIGDPVALRNVLGLNPEEFANFYPDMTLPELTTDETIDTFIDKFGDPAVKKRDELELMMTPTPGYDLSALEELPELAPDADSSEIPVISPDYNQKSPKKPTSPNNADIMHKQLESAVKSGDYEQAMEIITEFSLKNPKKSIYFADQMRFLKKLAEIKKTQATPTEFKQANI